MPSSMNNKPEVNQSSTDPAFKFKAAVFLSSVTGLSMLFGFGSALAAAKKKDPTFFDKGMLPSRKVPISGSSLALKALGIGTVYAFTGCGILFYSIWKILGVNNLQEFRMKVGAMLPKIPKNDPPQGRTEFENLSDLLTYLSGEETSKEKPVTND
ncbi:hypothetical protein J437_LFUL019353 [Ladona fulva]|uniref:Transmembrane protein 242 n=1 Tax=Ladona fulva TaxID=123851 RepID=A0A8K0KAS1_LADFU|nr:hypothetical protein J437_LFUL019353 [Ladona fulva]